MARINYELEFSKEVELFKNILAKDTLDGTASIIRGIMIQNHIVLADDDTDVDNAVTANKNFLAAEKLAKQLTGQRDSKYDPYFAFYKEAAQFLKGFYGKNFLTLGEWGFNITVNGRMIYSRDIKDNCDSIQDLINHHLSFPVGESPLQTFITENEYDVAAIALDLPNVKDLYDAHADAETDKTTNRQTRDNLINPVMKHVRTIGKFLKKNFISIPQNVSKWGYNMVMEPGDPREVSLALAHSEEKIIYNVINESDLTNTGGSIINAYKGKTMTGTPMVIGVGQTIIVPKEWGTMTLKNMSASIEGGIDYLKG